MFAFRVLPLIDDSLQALAIMAGIAFWPAVLKVFNRYDGIPLSPSIEIIV